MPPAALTNRLVPPTMGTWVKGGIFEEAGRKKMISPIVCFVVELTLAVVRLGSELKSTAAVVEELYTPSMT
jgi:hypothetical protein